MILRKKLFLLLDIVGIIVLVLADQFTKSLAVAHLKDKPAFNIISGVLELNYLENKGAAFGMLQNQKFIILFVGIVFLAVIIFFLFRMPLQKKYNIVHILLSVVIAGGIGNMVDRFRFDYVVDFIFLSVHS